VAPEVLKPKDKRKGYNEEVDMWSAGVILYILLCGFPPFYEEDQDKLFRQIIKGNYDFPSPYWDNISKEAIDMVRCCLTTDPDKRIAPAQALLHPWMTAENAKLDVIDIETHNLRKYLRKNKFKRVKNAIIAVGRLQLALRNSVE
jgi:serine/threonine protein kinase